MLNLAYLPHAFCILLTSVSAASAGHPAFALFRDHCFSPFLTASRAHEAFSAHGLRWDFYDLDPFSSASPSPATGRAVTPGTDRRCEIALDGKHEEAGVETVAEALRMEGIHTKAAVPDGFPKQPGATFVAARQLNPRRVAVVQVGTRPGPNGTETYLNVERLNPLEDPV